MSENRITIRGVTGTLYWGYFLAGTVGSWTVVRGGPTDPGTLTATVITVDTFRASQHPITFVVQHKHGVWRWALDTLQIADGMLTARLSPPKEVLDGAASSTA